MGGRIAGFLILFVGVLAAGKNENLKPAEARGENESVVITATAYTRPEAVKELIGSDLDGHYIVLDVKVAPRFGKHVDVRPDDFLLKTDKDGERSAPFAPSQIAGRGVLVVSQTSGGSGATPVHDNSGPVWGGYPGSMGQPRRLGGDGIGNTGSAPETEAKQTPRSKQKENPLLKVLADKELPETKTDQPVSGLLYFPMDKQKVKDLELRYDMSGDKIVMRFRQDR